MNNKTVYLEVMFGPEVPADIVRQIKNSLHKHAEELCDGIKNRTILSVIKVDAVSKLQPKPKGKKR